MKSVSRYYVTALANNKWGQRDSPRRRLLGNVSSDDDDDDDDDFHQKRRPLQCASTVSICQRRSPQKQSSPIVVTTTDVNDWTNPAETCVPPPCSLSHLDLPLTPRRNHQSTGKHPPRVVDSWTSFKPDKQSSFPGDLWSIPTSSNTPWIDIKGTNDETGTSDQTKVIAAFDTPNDSLRKSNKDSDPILVQRQSGQMDAVPLSPPRRNGVDTVIAAVQSPEETRHSLVSLNKSPKTKDSPRRRRPKSPRKQDQTEKGSKGKDKTETNALVYPVELIPVSPRRKKSSRRKSNENLIQTERPEINIRHALLVPQLDGQNDNHRVEGKGPLQTDDAAANDNSPISSCSPSPPSPRVSSSTTRRHSRGASQPKRRVSRDINDVVKHVQTTTHDKTRVPKPLTIDSRKGQSSASAKVSLSPRVKSPPKRRMSRASLALLGGVNGDTTGTTETIMNPAKVSHPEMLTEGTKIPVAVTLPEVMESLVIARANSKSVRDMRSIDDDTVAHLDDIMNRVGWTTIVLKEPRANGTGPDDNSTVHLAPQEHCTENAASVSPRVGAPHLGKLMGSDITVLPIGKIARFEGTPATLDLVPHVVALDDDLDGENSVFHPCPLVLLDVSSDEPRGVCSSPAFSCRRASRTRRSSRNADHLLDCDAFRRQLEASCPTPLQLASCVFPPPEEKEIWREQVDTTDLGKDEIHSSSVPVSSTQQRQKLKEPDVKSPHGRRKPIAGDDMFSPRKRDFVSTRIGKRNGSHKVKTMHGSDSALPMLLLEMAMNEPQVSPSFDDTRRRTRRLAREIDADGEKFKHEPVTSPRSPMRRRHSSHWRDKTDHVSRCTSISKPVDSIENIALAESPILTGGGRKPRIGEHTRISIDEGNLVEKRAEEITESPKDKACPRTSERPSRRLSASIMQELQSDTKTKEVDQAPTVTPRFSVLRRIAMFSKSSEPSTKTNQDSKSPRTASRPSINSCNTMRGDCSGAIDWNVRMNSRGDEDTDEAGAIQSNSPHLPTSATMRIGQLPLTYRETTNTELTPSLTYRERRLDALCRVPPRIDSTSLDNLVSVKERLVMFQQAATKSSIYRKGNVDRNYESIVRSKCHPSIMVGHLESPRGVSAGDKTIDKQVVDDNDNSSTVSDMSSPS